MTTEYHSALSEEKYKGESIGFWVKELNDSLSYATTVDISKINNLPKLYESCDVLYSEPMWDAGVNKFNERAQISADYKDYLRNINTMCKTKPSIIVMGKKAKAYLTDVQQVLDVSLNGAKAQAYVYNMSVSSRMRECITAKQLIEYIAIKYNRVGDFCCGYGRTGRIFYEHNKSFVQSDYNGKCIAYIKQYYEDILKR